MTTLLATKLYQPYPPSKRVRRPHLIRRLNEGIESERRITLVSAPAGFGKTTCVSEWVSALDYPVTWLSLDSTDDDPGRFFAYFIAALQRVDENLCQEVESVLRSGQLPPAEVISTTLINDILELGSRFLLILDDFQVIQDGFILEVVEKLVTNLPQPLHLVLLTREDPPLPLARLRANNQMTEIRAGDLRFSSPEVARFLNEVMGLSLSRADIAALEDRTEGWIVGLQLAAIAMTAVIAQQSPVSVQDRVDPSSFIAALSGSHRFILSYLTEQVLSGQPEEIQLFLLQTSILDKLNGDLCNAVTGRTDSHTLLEQLFSANLFLIPLDDEHKWYRYHHLFADLLRDLQATHRPDETAELHRRAGRWYAQAGDERRAFASEAIRHALAAADYAMAVGLLESYATAMIMQGYAKTVDGWVQAIPPEWDSASPRTHLAFAWMHALRGTYAQAFSYIEQLQAAFQEGKESDPSIKAEWLALQSLMLNMQGKSAESMALANQALEIAPQEDSHARSLVYFGLAGTYHLMEDYPHAVEAYQMAIQHGRAAGNLIAEMMSTSGLASMALEHGQLHLAFEIGSQAVDRIERSGVLPPISTVVYGTLGQVYYEWHQLEQARRYILRAIELSALGGYSTGAVYYPVLLSRLLQIEGDMDAAAREIQKAVDRMQVEAPADLREEVIYHQVHIYLAQNRLAAAEMALQGHGISSQDTFSSPDLFPGQNITYSTGLLYNGMLRVLLYQARARHEPDGLRQGIELADRLIARAIQDKYVPIALEALLLRAQMHAAIGDSQTSQVDYTRALALAEPEGFISVFVEEGSPVIDALANLIGQDRLGSVQPDYVKRILAAFSDSQPPSTARDEQPAPNALIEPTTRSESPTLIESLTDRELDVLRSMAEGLKYREIAERLFISLNTVRTHVKAIYSKLGVSNRTKAIEMARQLELL